MNPQYIQQQRPLYGAPQGNAPYGELNANLPPKGPQDLHTYSVQRPSPGPQPTNNAPPTSNAPPMTRPPYYVNDVHGQAPDAQLGPTPQQPNHNNIVDQMSNMALSSSQRPPSSQDFPQQTDRATPTMPCLSSVNGVNNQNHYPPQGNMSMNSIPTEQKSEQAVPKPFLYHQQGPPVSQAPSLPSSGGFQFPGQMPYSNQPPQSSPGTNIPRSTSGTLPTMDYHNQMSTQNKFNAPPTNQATIAESSLSKKPTSMPPTSSSQQPYGQYPSQNQPQLTSQNQPQLTSQNQPQLTSQNQPQLTSPTQPPLGPPPTINQQSMSGPPLPGSLSSAPPMPSRQSLSGPPVPGQHLPNPLAMNQQSFSRPPLPGQSSGISGPSLSGQPNLSGPYGHQNITEPTPSQNLQSQYSYNNQMPEQRRYSPNATLTGQQNTLNSYNHLNHQHSEPSYQQGYQQPNYGYSGQPNAYNQTNQYQSGLSSPTGGYQSSAQSQQARRLDPEQMPSPIQVIQDDQRLKGGMFTTNQKGLVPPLVTTKFTVEDQGNASPRFIRSSMYSVPTTADIIKQTQIPFALILSPLAQVEEGEYEPPIVDMGEIGPVRCIRCKAYMSPFMQFIDAGRRFQCMFCKATTEVPAEYFQHLDHTGQRMDRYERPELMLGTYEFVATKDYCRDNTFPKPPAVIFVIDVSYNTVKSGLVSLLCSQMKKIIRNLPVEIGEKKSKMKVGFITYGSSVQFYNLKASLAQPQMMVVGDVHDVFMPLLDGFLVDPIESEALIDSLMSQIPTMFGDTKETEIILAPAIQAGLEALKASECAGKLMVFHSSLPIADAPGKLKNRDDRKLIGTDKEKSVLAPQNNVYNHLGQDCVGAGCSVDLFVFNNSYVDIATIGQVARLTGGEVYKYTYFQADVDGERLITDIINNISRPVVFDAVMRVRTSTGVRPTDFYGNFYMSNTTDIELASIDCDKALAIEIKHDDKLAEDEGVYIQAALLYTSCSGIRRLRIINLSLKTSSQMAELYRACDLDAVINFLFKQSVFKLVESSSKQIKDNLNARCAAILASYRKHCASPSSAGQLILPECMKLLPLYINGIQKSDAITGGGGITIDQKSYVMMAVATMPIIETVAHVYPRLLPLHDVDPQKNDFPPMLRCSIDKFIDDGAYLLENGIHMFLWLGSALNPQWVQSVFGVPSVNQVDTDRTTIPNLDNPLNKQIRDIIVYVQSERRYSMRLTLTKQRDKMEMVMRQFLIEDRGADGSQGYVDFLCHMHREIRTLLS